MNQQQQSQMPPNQPQVPDHRLSEMQERLRVLELQNMQLRTTLDQVARPQNPNQPAQPGPFKPEVEDAITQILQRRLEPIQQQYKQQIGFLADQLDQARFEVNYGSDKFKPYHEKVKQVRDQELAQGRYMTREEALRLVHFEETGKKQITPEPPKPQETAPKFDPFFGTNVDPQTGLPVQPNQQMQDPNWQESQPQNPQVPQQFAPQYQTAQPPQYPPQNQPYPQQTPPGARQPMQTNHPYGNAYGQQFTLPNQGVNNPTHQSQPNPRAPLNLETATEADLEAFERNFGEISL